MRDELHNDSIDSGACKAAPSAAGAETSAAAAEPHKYIKGRLKAKLAFWKLFYTSAWVLSWITDGYQIPWANFGAESCNYALGRDGPATSSCLCQSIGSSEAP